MPGSVSGRRGNEGVNSMEQAAGLLARCLKTYNLDCVLQLSDGCVLQLCPMLNGQKPCISCWLQSAGMHRCGPWLKLRRPRESGTGGGSVRVHIGKRNTAVTRGQKAQWGCVICSSRGCSLGGGTCVAVVTVNCVEARLAATVLGSVEANKTNASTSCANPHRQW